MLKKKRIIRYYQIDLLDEGILMVIWKIFYEWLRDAGEDFYPL